MTSEKESLAKLFDWYLDFSPDDKTTVNIVSNFFNILDLIEDLQFSPLTKTVFFIKNKLLREGGDLLYQEINPIQYDKYVFKNNVTVYQELAFFYLGKLFKHEKEKIDQTLRLIEIDGEFNKEKNKRKKDDEKTVQIKRSRFYFIKYFVKQLVDNNTDPNILITLRHLYNSAHTAGAYKLSSLYAIFLDNDSLITKDIVSNAINTINNFYNIEREIYLTPKQIIDAIKKLSEEEQIEIKTFLCARTEFNKDLYLKLDNYFKGNGYSFFKTCVQSFVDDYKYLANILYFLENRITSQDVDIENKIIEVLIIALNNEKLYEKTTRALNNKLISLPSVFLVQDYLKIIENKLPLNNKTFVELSQIEKKLLNILFYDYIQEMNIE
jgi:hypothetical protein